MINIRIATEDDLDLVWPVFREVVVAGDTYAYEQETSIEAAFKIWFQTPRQTFVVEEGGEVLGSYYIKTNQAGPGSHVCNCGYMVSSKARGKGLATLMCLHSQQTAIEMGYKAMQFNFVAASNTGAIRLWHKLGFDTVGRLPGAFNHPDKGFLDALVMYKWLE